MVLEKSNKVTNVGRVKFIELILDLFHVLTLEELHYAIPRITKRITRQKGIISIEGNLKKICIRHAKKVLLAPREIKEIFASS